MNRRNPEWLERDEPTRIPPEDVTFKQTASKDELWRVGLTGARCLAKELANAKGFNSASDVTRGATTYGDSRELEDGSREALIGCRGCSAICTIIKSARTEQAAPGTEENPNTVVSVAEAPWPNPWDMMGSFDDCKAGVVTVPPEADRLARPMILDEEQRAMLRLALGHFD